jgi:hypothetical protein
MDLLHLLEQHGIDVAALDPAPANATETTPSPCGSRLQALEQARADLGRMPDRRRR